MWLEYSLHFCLLPRLQKLEGVLALVGIRCFYFLFLLLFKYKKCHKVFNLIPHLGRLYRKHEKQLLYFLFPILLPVTEIIYII